MAIGKCRLNESLNLKECACLKTRDSETNKKLIICFYYVTVTRETKRVFNHTLHIPFNYI